MGLLGKIFKKVAESAGDSKKSDKTATSAELSQMDKEIEKELEQLHKDQEAWNKRARKILPKL